MHPIPSAAAEGLLPARLARCCGVCGGVDPCEDEGGVCGTEGMLCAGVMVPELICPDSSDEELAFRVAWAWAWAWAFRMFMMAWSGTSENRYWIGVAVVAVVWGIVACAYCCTNSTVPCRGPLPTAPTDPEPEGKKWRTSWRRKRA